MSFCWEIDDVNQRPLLSLAGLVLLSAPSDSASGFPTFLHSLSRNLVIGASRCQMSFDPPLHRKQKYRIRSIQH